MSIIRILSLVTAIVVFATGAMANTPLAPRSATTVNLSYTIEYRAPSLQIKSLLEANWSYSAERPTMTERMALAVQDEPWYRDEEKVITYVAIAVFLLILL